MTTSVVIALYNGAPTIGEQLDALATQTVEDFELVVADNGSTDGGADLVRARGIRVVDASRQRGPSYARNIGARATAGKHLLFCDADDVADPGWVEAMSAALDKWDLVGGQSEIESLNHGRSGWRGEPLHPVDGTRPFPAVTGSNFGIRRGVFEAMGGWSEDFSAGDVVLCWQAQMRGCTLGYANDAVMHYRFRSDMRSHLRQQYRYGWQMGKLRRWFAELDHPPVVPWWRTAAWLGVHVPMLARRETVGRWLGVVAQAIGLRVGLAVN